MQFIDYPGRKDSTGQSGRNAQSAEKGPPRQMKIYLSRIPLEEFAPKKPASAAGPEPVSEKERIARHLAAQQQPPIPARPAANGHTQPAAPSAAPAAVLHKAPGRDPRRPPLPPKKSDSKEDDGKKKSFWSRVMSDQR